MVADIPEVSRDVTLTGSRAGARPLAVQVIVAAFALACLFWGIARVPLMDPDEGRNAEVAREMAATNDYVLPALNGLPYLDKPILYFAAEAAVMEVLGPTELAARLPAVLFTVATALLVWWSGRRMFEPEVGPLAALMFLSAPLTMAFSRIVIFDSALTFFVTAAVVCLYLALPDDRSAAPPRSSRRWVLAGWAALALGVLTKGPVALALPLVVVLPIAVVRRSARRLFSPWALLLFVALIAPWVVGVSLRRPDFLEYVFVTETVARVATGKLHRSAPFWYFVPLLLGGAFPWSISFLAAIVTQVRRRWTPQSVLCVLWVLVPLALFSLSNSKRPQYVLPLIVPIALLSADFWFRLPSSRRISANVIGGIFGVAGAVLCGAAMVGGVLERVEAPLRSAAATSAISLGAIFLVCGMAGLVLRRWPRLAAVAFAAGVLLIPVGGAPVLAEVGNLRSTRDAVSALPQATRDHGRIVFIDSYEPSLTFYARREALLVTSDADEIRSNYLPAHFDELVSASGTTLRRHDWLVPELSNCLAGDVFISRKKDPVTRELQARFPVATADRDLLFFGPCQGAPAR